jgi:hypothetical protein
MLIPIDGWPTVIDSYLGRNKGLEEILLAREGIGEVDVHRVYNTKIGEGWVLDK